MSVQYDLLTVLDCVTFDVLKIFDQDELSIPFWKLRTSDNRKSRLKLQKNHQPPNNFSQLLKGLNTDWHLWKCRCQSRIRSLVYFADEGCLINSILLSALHLWQYEVYGRFKTGALIIGVCFPLSCAFHVICFSSVFYFGYNSASYNSMISSAGFA